MPEITNAHRLAVLAELREHQAMLARQAMCHVPLYAAWASYDRWVREREKSDGE